VLFSCQRAARLANWARGAPFSLLAGLLLALGGQQAAAQNSPVLTERFEGPTPSWRQPADRAGAKIIKQQRIRAESTALSAEESTDGTTGVEWLRFACPAGYSGLFLHPIGRAPVIEELQISLDFRGLASGAQLAVRVVLPRSTSGSSAQQRPAEVSMIVRADLRYEQPGEWRKLTIDNLPLLVKRQARLLRAQSGGNQTIDERGAYVDHVALIVPGSAPAAEFWTDNLVIQGVLEGQDQSTAAGADQPGPDPTTVVALTPSGFERSGAGLFPRVWSPQGEPMQAICRLGFSAVAFEGLASPDLLAEAERRNLAVFCPAPSVEALEEIGEKIGGAKHLDNVLGWTLAGQQNRLTLDAAAPELARLRNDQRLAGRPVLAATSDGITAWSRRADALILDDRSGDDAFAHALRLARLGTPALARISLDWSPRTMDQLQGLAPAGKAVRWRSAEAIESLALSAIAAGAKGLWLDADKPLLGAGSEQRRIAATVELLNLKLALIEPWLITNDSVGAVLAADRTPVAAVLDRARTKVVVGYRKPAAKRTSAATMLVVPGVSETASVYALSPAGLAPLASRRTLGGVAVSLGALAPGEFLLLTDDRAAVRDIQRRIARSAQRAVKLQQQLVTVELAEWERLVAETPSLAETRRRASLVAIVKQQISRSKAAQAIGDWLAAYQACSLARRQISTARAAFGAQLAPSAQLASSPLVLQPATWPDELRLRQLIRALPREGNLLTGGDFEDLNETRQAGWRHTQIESALGAPSATSSNNATGATVELSTHAPRHGERCLTLRSQSPSQGQPVAWITSPATPVGAGQLLEITGWVRLEGEADAGSRLEIVDSLGGQQLALTADCRPGWRPFHMLRRPTKSESLQLSFVLTGAGEASIDAVMIRPIRLASSTQEADQPPRNARRGPPSPRPAASR